MKYHKLPLIAAFAALALSAFAADTKDQMITKIIGQPPTSSAAAGKPPYAIAAHALVGKDNSIAVNAWTGGLVFQGSTWNQFTTAFAITDPTANRTITFPNSSGTVLLTAVDDWVFEGPTADAYETTITAVDPTADGTIYLPNTAVGIADANLSFVVSTINSGLNAPGLATSVWTGVSSLYFEGATADTSEMALDSADPTADVIYRLADAAAGTYGFVSSTLATNAPDIANSVWGASNGLVFEGSTADAYETTFTPTDPTADRTITVPNASGTVTLAQGSTTTALTADNQAVTPGSNTRLQLTSDNATATNRTFTLSATGAITGQIYVLIGPDTNQCEIAATGIQKLSATWSPTTSDTLTLLFDGTNFLELARSNN